MKRNKIYMIRTIKCRNVIAIRVVWVSCLLFWFHFLIRDSHSGRQTDGWLAVCWFFFWFATNKKETKRRKYIFFYFSVKLFFYFITFPWVIFFPETIILSSAKVNMHCDIGPETSPIASTPLNYKSHDAVVFKRFGDRCMHVTHIMSLNMHIRMNKKLPKFILYLYSFAL